MKKNKDFNKKIAKYKIFFREKIKFWEKKNSREKKNFERRKIYREKKYRERKKKSIPKKIRPNKKSILKKKNWNFKKIETLKKQKLWLKLFFQGNLICWTLRSVQNLIFYTCCSLNSRNNNGKTNGKRSIDLRPSATALDHQLQTDEFITSVFGAKGQP